jgi:Fic family protein
MGDSNNPAPPTGYRWREIEDPLDSIASHADPELDALRAMWQVERERLDPASVERVSGELAREWAIETGIIEGVYTLDRGITLTLIEHGIKAALIPHDATNKDPELVARIIQTHKDVLEGLFAFVKGERTLSTSYIKELHAGLMRYQPTFTAFDQFGQHSERELKRGEYKALPNSPVTPDGTVHEYCPPEHVASEMNRMVALHAEHTQRGVVPQVAAAWLHHAFTQIHPFQDGNGRVARAIASLVFIKAGDFPLVVTRDDRAIYINALESADGGDLSLLVSLFGILQRRKLTKAIGRAYDLKPAGSVDDALNITRDLLVGLDRITRAEYLQAKNTALAVVNAGHNALNGVLQRLQADISKANPQYSFSVGSYATAPKEELRELASLFAYVPNPSDLDMSHVLTLKVDQQTSQLVVLLHSVGNRFKGQIVAVAYFKSGPDQPIPICDEIFRISYQEDVKSAVERYKPWLDACLIRGLAEWRRTLV